MPRTPQSALTSLAAIGVIVAAAAGAFAYTAGWLSPHRLTPARVVDALSERGGNPIGHRRNHSKGVCFTGVFDAGGAGARLSMATMLAPGRYPVVGRFAIAVGDPMASDVTGRVRSMAVRIVAPDGQEWRSGMNNMPVFVVATPRAFFDLTVASRADPATGKPDMRTLGGFVASHPEMAPFNAWAHSAPWTKSFADQSYNGLDAFIFVDHAGGRHAVRWSMQAITPAVNVSPEDLAKLGADFLEQDLKQRLQGGALHWRMVATVAQAGDQTADPTKAWPADREQVVLGTLTVEQTQDEANGPCRDLNYDPLILPAGIEPSDDPILPARSSTYANSFDRRTAEAAAYPRAGTEQPK